MPTRNGGALRDKATTSSLFFYLISENGGMCSMALSIFSFLDFQSVISLLTFLLLPFFLHMLWAFIARDEAFLVFLPPPSLIHPMATIHHGI